MDQLANLIFSAITILIVFGYSAYRDRKRAETERLLIEAGKADAVLEAWRERRRRTTGLIGGSFLVLIALGCASVLSAAVLRIGGVGERFGNADVWFVVFGIFLIALGLAYAFARKRDQSGSG
jgi:hypothetical protein